MKKLLLIFSLLLSTISFSQTTYSGNTNTGFGDVVGNSSLEFNDDGTTITGTFTKGSGNFNDAMVIYISTGATGRSVIDANVNDQGDPLRRAISSAGDNASDITFPTGFEATHAIAINTSFGGLWSIPTTNPIGDNELAFEDAVGNPTTSTQASFTFNFDWAELGLTSSDYFDFVVVYMNGGNGFLSDEAYGGGIASGNPGGNAITFSSSLNYPYRYVYNGSWLPSSPDGLTETSNSALVKSGTTSFTSNTSLATVAVESGASLDIDPSVILTLSGDLINEGTFTFKSDASGSAQLESFSGTITGDITVERFIPAKRAFRLLSSPVGGDSFADAWQQDTHITGSGGAANGFDVTSTNNASLFTFDNSIDPQTGGAGWQAVTSTGNLIMAGTPYRLLVRGDRSIDLTNNDAPANNTTLMASGSMQTGSFSPSLATVANNFSFVGNPYQAVVNFSLVTRSNLTDFMYVWDSSVTGSNGNGGYITVEVSSGSITAPSPSSSDATEFIAPGQAFFVQNSGSGNGSITFEEADKTTAETQVTVFSEYTNFYINSRLYKSADLMNGDMESDAIGLRFNENFTTLGSDEDAGKLSNPSENYAINNNGFKSIDKQNIPIDGHEVELYISNYEAINYSLTFELDNQPENMSVFLNDTYLNTQTELASNTTYDFTVDESISESIATDRFKLVFEEVSLNNEAFTADRIRLYPNPVVNTLQVEIASNKDYNHLTIYNTIGQEVMSSKAKTIDVSNLTPGVYFVELNTSEGKITKKIIKQ